MKYPEDRKRSTQAIKIAEGLHQAIDDFLETDVAHTMGYRFKSDIVNAAVREFLIRAGFDIEAGPRFEHFNIYEDHVTIFDKKLRQMMDVSFKEGNVYCTYCETDRCDHVDFIFTLPKVVKMLEDRGWRIIEGKIVKRPS